MTRTVKKIFIRGVSIDEAKNAVIKWFQENNVKVLINNPDYLYGRWGRGIINAPKFFEVELVPAIGGVIADVEGWIAFIPPSWSLPLAALASYIPETEFTESTVSYGWMSRKEGRHESYQAFMENP